jgi:hypothetical protein
MPTFTGETGARIKDMEARLAALEAGGSGFDPRTGVFSALRYFPFVVPSNARTSIPMDQVQFDFSGWFNTTTGRYNPKVAGYYHLSASIYISTLFMNGVGVILSLHKDNFDHSIINSTRLLVGSGDLISGTTIVKANGTTDSWMPALYHVNDQSVNVESIDGGYRTLFQAELIAPA